MNIAKTGLLIFVALAVTAGLFIFIDPIPQWPEYHDFADDRAWLILPNAHNVLSNLGLLLVGAWGSLFVISRDGREVTGKVAAPYFVFFFGVFLTAFGSAYYHWEPENATLGWDRLPMTLMFMGFFTVAIGELISPRTARVLLLPLLIAGIASVVYWAWTELNNAGDLRFYGLVQFLPIILIVLMLFLYPKPPHFLFYIVGLIVFFSLAKLFEQFDQQIYDALKHVVAGHALKHLFAAAAACSLLLMLYKRRRSSGRI